MAALPRLLDNLNHELAETEFKSPGFGDVNIAELLKHSAISPKVKSTLLLVLSCILDEHQKKANSQGEEDYKKDPSVPKKPKFEWKDKQQISDIDELLSGEKRESSGLPYSNHYVSNWKHTLEEVMHLFVFAKKLTNIIRKMQVKIKISKMP